jgi:sigma-B regulation protein RsbU (phosphoserine phosphatase)
MWYGVYNTQSRVLRYASGGHPPALLFGGGQVQELKTPCMIIGGMPDMEYTSDEVTVAAGSALYVYSDGVYEIAPPDGDMWAFEAFVEFMGQRGHAPLDELYQHVMAMHARETLDDDFSIMRLAFA